MRNINAFLKWHRCFYNIKIKNLNLIKMKDRWKILIVSIIITAIIALISFFLAFSFKRIELRQYGVLQYNFYHTVDQAQTVRTNGNYLIGLDYDFYKYPKGLLKHDFNVEILTRDKSVIQVQGMFIGQLIESQIINLHFSYGPLSYAKIIDKNIEEIFRETIQQFMLNEIIADRKGINSYVKSNVCLNIQSRYSFIDCQYVSTGKMNINKTPKLLPSDLSIQKSYKNLLEKSREAQKKMNIYDNGGFNLIQKVQTLNSELFFNTTQYIFNTISSYTPEAAELFAGASYILDNPLLPPINNQISIRAL